MLYKKKKKKESHHIREETRHLTEEESVKSERFISLQLTERVFSLECLRQYKHLVWDGVCELGEGSGCKQ